MEDSDKLLLNIKTKQTADKQGTILDTGLKIQNLSLSDSCQKQSLILSNIKNTKSKLFH